MPARRNVPVPQVVEGYELKAWYVCFYIGGQSALRRAPRPKAAMAPAHNHAPLRRRSANLREAEGTLRPQGLQPAAGTR